MTGIKHRARRRSSQSRHDAKPQTMHPKMCRRDRRYRYMLGRLRTARARARYREVVLRTTVISARQEEFEQLQK